MDFDRSARDRIARLRSQVNDVPTRAALNAVPLERSQKVVDACFRRRRASRDRLMAPGARRDDRLKERVQELRRELPLSEGPIAGKPLLVELGKHGLELVVLSEPAHVVSEVVSAHANERVVLRYGQNLSCLQTRNYRIHESDRHILHSVSIGRPHAPDRRRKV